MDNVKEKIRKLLAKATSQNEHEAQAALMKARELMAKHKLTEKEVGDAPSANRPVKKVIFTEDTFSPKVNSWFASLAYIIGSNHCCAVMDTGRKGSKLHTVEFAGIDDDAEIALEIFTYAVHHIWDRVKAERKVINKRYLDQEYRNMAVRRFEQGYAKGFIQGLKQQYEEQFKMQEDNETLAIVMVMPQEVVDHISGMNPSKFRAEDRGASNAAYQKGYEAGYTFNPTKQLTGQVEAV